VQPVDVGDRDTVDAFLRAAVIVAERGRVVAFAQLDEQLGARLVLQAISLAGRSGRRRMSA
jgi:hypothetical protein